MTANVLNARLPAAANILLVRGEDFRAQFALENSDGTAVGWAGYSAEAEIVDDAGNVLLAIPADAGAVTLDTSDPPTGRVTITLPRATVDALTWTCGSFRLWVTDPLGERWRLVAGLAVVSDGGIGQCPTQI